MKPTINLIVLSIWFWLSATTLPVRAQITDHLDIKATFKDSTIQVEASYKTSIPAQQDSVYFLLFPGIEVDSITADGLETYTRAMKPGHPIPFWMLKFRGDQDRSTPAVIGFSYSIDLGRQNHMRSNWIELNADKMWFPNRNDLNNPFTYTATIEHLPENYTLLGHTDAVIEQVDPETIRITKPTPWYEVLLLAGKDLKSFSYDKGITLWGNREIPDSVMRSIGEKVRKSTDLLNTYTGTHDKIEELSILLRNTTKKEIGFQFNRVNLIVTGTDFNTYGNLSHEIAHYWWRKANFLTEPWLNESLANFCMYQVLRTYEPEQYEQMLLKDKQTAIEAIPVAEATAFADGSFASYYTKGTVLLLELEEQIGRDKMQQLFTKLATYDDLSTEVFLNTLETISSPDHRSLFEQALKK